MHIYMQNCQNNLKKKFFMNKNIMNIEDEKIYLNFISLFDYLNNVHERDNYRTLSDS